MCDCFIYSMVVYHEIIYSVLYSNRLLSLGLEDESIRPTHFCRLYPDKQFLPCGYSIIIGQKYIYPMFNVVWETREILPLNAYLMKSSSILILDWGPPFKRVASVMGLNCCNILGTKFHNKFWATYGCQMTFMWFSAEDHLKIIWQPNAAQDLLWNLILKTLQELSSMSLTSLEARTSSATGMTTSCTTCFIQVDHIHGLLKAFILRVKQARLLASLMTW